VVGENVGFEVDGVIVVLKEGFLVGLVVFEKVGDLLSFLPALTKLTNRNNAQTNKKNLDILISC
jgi:hypothetical protein